MHVAKGDAAGIGRGKRIDRGAKGRDDDAQANRDEQSRGIREREDGGSPRDGALGLLRLMHDCDGDATENTKDEQYGERPAHERAGKGTRGEHREGRGRDDRRNESRSTQPRRKQ